MFYERSKHKPSKAVVIFVPITTLRVRTYVHACIRTRTLYVPGGAFIKRVFDTSTGIVINVATPPCKAQTNTTSQLCFDIGDVYKYYSWKQLR